MTESDDVSNTAAEAKAPPSDDNNGDELDLDAAMDALDFDMNCLESNNSFTEEAQEAEPGTTVVDEPQAIPAVEKSKSNEVNSDDSTEDDWKTRSEIYSRHFKPDPRERARLEAIASLLGVKSGLKDSAGSGNKLMGSLLGGGGSSSADSQDNQSQWNRLVSGKDSSQTQNLPVSIVLRQGTVLYKDYDEESQQPITHHGCECVLLTRGFFLAERDNKSAGFFGKKQESLSPLGSCLWTEVRQIQTTNQQTLLLRCGGTNDSDGVTFEILPSGDLMGFRSAIQAAATQAHLHFVSKGHDELGWQHRLCHTPWFTEAVTGEWEADQEQGQELSIDDSAEKGLDGLDAFHSYAPLHYATRANHTEIMQRLLEAGANPNVKDGEGKTPMYFAQRDELPPATTQILEQYGADKSQKAEDEMRGELFGKVADTEKEREVKRDEEEAAAKAAQDKAESAQSQMAQNMAAMHHRGEQIEELGDKASDLQDGAKDYADMAAQLKEKLKKKSRWGF